MDGRLATMEHAAQRVLRIQRAVGEGGGKGPDFDGLETYMQRAEGSIGAAHVPMIDAGVSDQLKSQGYNANALKTMKSSGDDDDKKDKKEKKGKGEEKGNKADK